MTKFNMFLSVILCILIIPSLSLAATSYYSNIGEAIADEVKKYAEEGTKNAEKAIVSTATTTTIEKISIDTENKIVLVFFVIIIIAVILGVYFYPKKLKAIPENEEI